MKTILQKLREPSTWAGIGMIAAVAGIKPDVMNAIAQAGIAIAGLVAIYLPEGQA